MGFNNPYLVIYCRIVRSFLFLTMIFKTPLRCCLFMLLAGMVSTNVFAQTDNAIYRNYERAYSILKDAQAALNYYNTVGEVEIFMDGKFNDYDHLDQGGRPPQYDISSHILFTESGKLLTRTDTLTRSGKTYLSSYKVDGTTVKVSDMGKEVKTAEQYKDRYMYRSAMFNPNLLVDVILRDPIRMGFFGNDSASFIIRYTNRNGDIYFLYINDSTYLPTKIIQPGYDKLTGDYFVTTEYKDYDIEGGFLKPGKIIVKRGSNTVYDISLKRQIVIQETRSSKYQLTKKEVGVGVYIIPLEQWNSKAVLADFEDYMVVFDPPDGLEAGGALLDFIKRTFPGKELRYCVYSHFHQDVTGGIRPFIANGTTIITTPGIKDLVDKMSMNKHLFAGESGSKTTLSAKYQFVTDEKFELRTTGKSRLVVYNMGKKSGHSDDYLISYLPTEKILVESDLIPAEKLVNQRELTGKEKELIEFIKDKKLYIKSVIQNFPLNKVPEVIDYELINPPSSAERIRNVFR